MNNSKLLINSLIGTSILSVGIGGIVLGSDFNSWEQLNVLNDLSKYSQEDKALKTKIADLNNLVKLEYSSSQNIDEMQALNFTSLLNIIFNGDTKQDIAGPMWVSWNAKLSKLMSIPNNFYMYGSLKFENCFTFLLENKNPTISEKTKEIELIIPVFNRLELSNASSAGFIIGITILSLTSVPLTILVILLIKIKMIKLPN